MVRFITDKRKNLIMSSLSSEVNLNCLGQARYGGQWEGDVPRASEPAQFALYVVRRVLLYHSDACLESTSMRSDTMLSTKSLLARVEPTPDKCHPSWGACTARYPPHCYNKQAKLCECEGDLKKSCRNAIDERTLAAETENLQSQCGHQSQTAINRCQQ